METGKPAVGPTLEILRQWLEAIEELDARCADLDEKVEHLIRKKDEIIW